MDINDEFEKYYQNIMQKDESEWTEAERNLVEVHDRGQAEEDGPNVYYQENEPICPFCGEVYGDAWELHMNDSDRMAIECPDCGKEYEVSCCVSVTYDTNALEPMTEKVERARKHGYEIPDDATVGTVVKYKEYSYKIVQFGPYLKMDSVGSGLIGITF